jgi:hypothetical protein
MHLTTLPRTTFIHGIEYVADTTVTTMIITLRMAIEFTGTVKFKWVQELPESICYINPQAIN